MAPRITFAGLPDGFQPLLYWDQVLADTAKLGLIPCSASGVTTIALTPLTGAYPPVITEYANHLTFSFPAAGNSTGTVTINVNGVGAKPLYHQNGTSAVGSGDLKANAFYVVAYSSALNSGNGGFYLLTGSFAGLVVTGDFAPSADDGGALGTTSSRWSDLFLAPGGVINWASGDVTATHSTNALAFAGASSGYSFDAAVTPAASDGAALGSTALPWSDIFLASGSVINWASGDVTITHAANTLTFGGASSGYQFDALIAPSSDDGAPLGSSSLKWSDAFFASGAVINFNSGDVTITHAANTLTFGGASSGYQFDAIIAPSSDDGAPLGSASLKWSDAFFASGAVLNFNSGDVTLTHSTNLLAFAGASSGYTFDDAIVAGHTAKLAIGTVTSNAQVYGTSAPTASLTVGLFNSTGTNAPNISFYRSKDTSIGSAAAVASGDRLGSIVWFGAQQSGTFSNAVAAAQMRVEVDGTVTDGASGDMPGRMVWATTPDGSGTLTDRLILDSSGVLKPASDGGVALGTSSLAFANLFINTGGKIDFEGGDVTITHATNTLAFAGATSGAGGYTFDALISPATNDGAALGSTSVKWSDLWLASGGEIDFNSSDVRIQHAANQLNFVGADNGYFFSNAIQPTSNDGAALGTTSVQWSDLFLAEGGVINWDNGDVTITQTNNVLAFAGASSGYTFDAAAVIGHTAQLTFNSLATNHQVLGITEAASSMTLGMFGITGSEYPRFQFYRSLSGTVGNGTVVASGNVLGAVSWIGAQQTGTFATQSVAAQIRCEVDAAVTSGASGDMPGRIIFATTADGAGTVTDRLILDSTGRLKPNSNSGVTLGTSTLGYGGLHMATGTAINFANSDVTITHSSDLLAFAAAASGYTFDALLTVGHTANLSIGGLASNLEVLGTTQATASIAVGLFDATGTDAPQFNFYRSLNASIGSASVVASGNQLGKLTWYGAQQSGTFATQNPAAQIRAEVDGAVTSGAGGDMPGRIIFSTTADASGTLTDRLILDAAGVLKPNANDGVALGTGTLSFADVFLASGGEVNWNNSDVRIQHATNQLNFVGADNGFYFSNAIFPTSSDGAALGSASVQWSDLFLAEGGVINFDNGDVTITQSGNSLTIAGGNLIAEGTATNDSASAGQIGERVYAEVLTGSAVSLTTVTAANITSISLTAGDWDVCGIIHFTPANTTTVTALQASMSTTSATQNTSPNRFCNLGIAYTSVGNVASVPIPPTQISLSATTTVYLVALAVFGTSTCTGYGRIEARRVR